MEADPRLPATYSCHWHCRVGQLLPDHPDLWWMANSEADSTTVSHNIISTIVEHVIPALDRLASTEALQKYWLDIAEEDRPPIVKKYIQLLSNPNAEQTPQLLGDERSHSLDPLNIGQMALRDGNGTIAKEVFSAAIRRKKDDIRTIFGLGQAYALLGKTKQALMQFEEVIRIDSSNSEAHKEVANALMILGDLDTAINHYNIYLRLNPNDAGAHFSLGTALMSKGQTEEAAEEFRLASSTTR